MTICQVCKTKPVTMQGASTCSLKCASELNGDDPEVIRDLLSEEIYRIDTVCKSERERLQAEWRRANPGLMR